MTSSIDTVRFRTLIGAAALRELVASGTAAVLVDAGFDLADPAAGEAAWRAGRVPGSIYWHLDRDLSGAKTGRNGRHPLPDRDDFACLLGRSGIGPATQVIVFDRQGGPYAARAWWLLRWMGHSSVVVLDGGVQAWQDAGGALDTGAPVGAALDTREPYPDLAPAVATIDADTLAAQLGRARLIDARAGDRFRGEVEPLDAAAGHIPGALNRFFKGNLDAAGRFKAPAQLRAEFEPLLGGQGAAAVVHQCGSGVTACHNLLAMEHAGLAGSVLYPGSWSEWSADPSRPVARG